MYTHTGRGTTVRVCLLLRDERQENNAREEAGVGLDVVKRYLYSSPPNNHLLLIYLATLFDLAFAAFGSSSLLLVTRKTNKIQSQSATARLLIGMKIQWLTQLSCSGLFYCTVPDCVLSTNGE